MINNKSKVVKFYLCGVGINLIPVLFSAVLDEGNSEKWTLFFALFVFMLSFIFYLPFFCLTVKNIGKIERIIFLFLPFLFYVGFTILCFTHLNIVFEYSIFLALFLPYLLINFVYALYLELRHKKC
jgi:hypothetical protein